MSSYLILAQSDVTARALGAWLSLLGEEPMKESDPRCIVWGSPITSGAAAVAAYEKLVRLIDAVARGDDAAIPLNSVIVLVDAVWPSELSAVAEGGDWSHLIAMLILTFPEILWIFGVCVGPMADGWKYIAPNHELSLPLAHPHRDPLLDPTKLRDWVRSRTNCDLKTAGDDLRLPMRKELAAAIDEEKPYAYLHGYTAYRFGCRADVVTTWDSMKARFGDIFNSSDRSTSEPHGYWLLLEDMSLNFPDREKGVRLLRLEDRPKRCFKLLPHNETSQYRVLITTGQARPGDTALAENRSYLRTKTNGKGKVVFKPASGIFDLWSRAGLFRKRPGSRRKGNAPEYGWPPSLPQAADEATGHGAPGKLILIAENLIRRVEPLASSVKTVAEAAQGAVLAIDALELTGGRTPTTAIGALALKHRFEVMAECQFSGVEYHIWIQPRLDEIAEETAAICRWFHTGQRESATLNAEMHILNQLVGILREYNRFDEEQVCMNRIRHLHNTLWMRQRPFRSFLWPLLRYLELLLSSFSVFVAALLAWICLLSLLFWWAADHPNWGYGVVDAVTSFFSIGGPFRPEGSTNIVKSEWRYIGVAGIAILSGFIHLGVFISHLYSITMRR